MAGTESRAAALSFQLGNLEARRQSDKKAIGDRTLFAALIHKAESDCRGDDLRAAARSLKLLAGEIVERGWKERLQRVTAELRPLVLPVPNVEKALGLENLLNIGYLFAAQVLLRIVERHPALTDIASSLEEERERAFCPFGFAKSIENLCWFVFDDVPIRKSASIHTATLAAKPSASPSPFRRAGGRRPIYSGLDELLCEHDRNPEFVDMYVHDAHEATGKIRSEWRMRHPHEAHALGQSSKPSHYDILARVRYLRKKGKIKELPPLKAGRPKEEKLS